MPVGVPEFVDNPETRCPVILLLDTSQSMSGEPMEALNQGVQVFREEVLKDTKASLSVEVAIIGFGPVQLQQDFVTIDRFEPPGLVAEGGTPIGEAIEYALDLLEDRKETYKENGIQYYRPWIFLITDGAPTDVWDFAAQRLHQAEAQRRLLFFAVAVEGANMTTLKQIAPPNRAPIKLKGLNFGEFFEWLSTSMKRVSTSRVGEALALPPVGWGEITT